jgi:hypothetical protein
MESPSGYVQATMHRLPEPERAVAYMRLDVWATLAGATPYTGKARLCLGRLANPRHRCGNACYGESWPHALDHPEVWKGRDGRFIVTAHDYNMGPDHRAELEALAARYGAGLTIDPAWSWYIPDNTVLVVLTGNPPGAPVRRQREGRRYYGYRIGG